MKNPLTSKERRGLTAVAAAALLCIASGFVFRSCSSSNRHANSGVSIVVAESDSVKGESDKSDISKKKIKSSGKKKPRQSSQKKKTEKVYPTRDPLSQPCD